MEVEPAPSRVRVRLSAVYSEPAPSCAPFLIGTLLVIDAPGAPPVSVLLDCGWSEAFDAGAVLAPLRRLEPSLSGVLVSFGDLAHGGALPLLYRVAAARRAAAGERPLLFYMTPPANRLAQLALREAHNARVAEEPAWDAFTTADVDAAFNLRELGGPVSQVRFDAQVSLPDGAPSGVLATAYHAGHQLGGAMWRIVRGTESVVYAPIVNHRTEQQLRKADLAAIRSSSVLLMEGGTGGIEAGGSSSSVIPAAWSLPAATVSPAVASATPSSVDAQWVATLVEGMLSHLRKGGSVLLPSDTAGRSLELVARIDAALGTAYPFDVFFLSHESAKVLEHARTNLEFLRETAARSFSLGATATGLQLSREAASIPFDFRRDRSRVRVATSMDQISACLAGGKPCVVIAPWASLTSGHARALFMQWATNPRNAIIFTARGSVPPGSLGAQLLPALPGVQGGVTSPPSSISIVQTSTVPLSGDELKAWKAEREEEKRRIARAAAAARQREAEATELAEAAGAAAAAAAAATISESAATGGGAGEDAARGGRGGARRLRPSSGPYAPDDSASVALVELLDPAVGTPRFHGVGGWAESITGAWVRDARTGGVSLAVRFPTFARDSSGDARLVPSEFGLRPSGGEAFFPGMDEEVAPAAPGLSGPLKPGGVLDRLTRGGASAAAAAASGGNVAAGNNPLLASKRVRSSIKVRIACRVAFHPLEGRASGASLLNIIEAAAPLRLVLLAAGDAGGGGDGAESWDGTIPSAPLTATRLLAAAAVAANAVAAASVHVLGDSEVAVGGEASASGPLPGISAALDVSSNVAEVSLSLLDAPSFAALRTAPHPELRPLSHMLTRIDASHGVAYVSAQVQPGDEATDAALRSANAEVRDAVLPSQLVLAAPSDRWGGWGEGTGGGSSAMDEDSTSTTGHGFLGGGHLPVLLRASGALRLLDLRKHLAELGVACEFVEGALVTTGGVIVRRRTGGAGGVGTGVEVEGPACDEYESVRKAVRGCYVQV